MSTLFYPHKGTDHQPATGHGPAEKIALLKQHAPALVERAVRHLEERFSLKESDLERHDELFLRVVYHLEEADQLVVSEATLLRQSVKNALLNIGVQEIAEKALSDYVEKVREQIFRLSFTSVELFLEGAYVPVTVSEFYDQITPRLREQGIEDMARRYGRCMEDWTEPKNALSDEQMQRRFGCHPGVDQRYLSTNFDTASFGVVDNELRKSVKKVASRSLRRLGPEAFFRSMRSRIAMSLELVRPGEERRFHQEDIHLAGNGYGAFDLLRRAMIPAGSRVLASCEEYDLMLNEMTGNSVEVAPFASLEDLIWHLDSGGRPFDFILLSELGRKGRIFPLSVFHEARQLLSPNPRLIVDACQSAGRRPLDMRACRADAVVLSTYKGSSFGKGYGVLALADGYGRGEVQGLKSSLREDDLAATAFAMDPSGLDTMSLAERSNANDLLAGRFLKLVEAINGDAGHRIKILTEIDSRSGLPPILELEVEGVSREELHKTAKLYGVHIAADYSTSASDVSIRIAFHPYMGNDSIKLLAYVLLAACDC